MTWVAFYFGCVVGGCLMAALLGLLDLAREQPPQITDGGRVKIGGREFEVSPGDGRLRLFRPAENRKPKTENRKPELDMDATPYIRDAFRTGLFWGLFLGALCGWMAAVVFCHWREFLNAFRWPRPPAPPRREP